MRFGIAAQAHPAAFGVVYDLLKEIEAILIGLKGSGEGH